jgi:hypothetical protein
LIKVLQHGGYRIPIREIFGILSFCFQPPFILPNEMCMQASAASAPSLILGQTLAVFASMQDDLPFTIRRLCAMDVAGHAKPAFRVKKSRRDTALTRPAARVCDDSL